jgi:hypothetical protein
VTKFCFRYKGSRIDKYRLQNLVFLFIVILLPLSVLLSTQYQNYHQKSSIEILNPQSYPKVNENWTVFFKTTGKANLIIKAINGTSWSLNALNEEEENDLKFLEIKCGSQTLNFQWVNDSIFIGNYSCLETSYEISKVSIVGKHTLEFKFGSSKAYAYNSPGSPDVKKPRTYNSLDQETSTFNQGENVTIKVNVTDAEGTLDLDYVYGNITYPNGSKAQDIFYSPIDSTNNGYKFQYAGSSNELIAVWSFEENSGERTIDFSNYTNNGTLVNGPNWTNGKFGKGLSFDCVDDYVDVGNSMNLSPSQYTISLWAKNSSTLNSERVLLTKGIHNITYRLSVLPDGRVKFIVQNASYNLMRVGSVILNSSEDELWSAVIDPKGEFAYFGTGTSPGKVIKIRLSDFTRVGSITFDSGEDLLYPAVIDPRGEFAYFGTYTSPGKVVKVNLSAFTRVDSITLASGEDYLFSAVIDPKGEFAYFGADTSPGKIVKVNLNDFTRVNSITFDSGENYLWSAVIDPKGEFAYFGTSTSPGKVVKVNLSNLTRAGSITFDSGEDYLISAIIDQRGEFAYFGTYNSPGKVVKVRLSDFTRVGSITLLSGEYYLWSAIIDQRGEFAYFGTDTDPGQVVKVRLSDFTRVGSITFSIDEDYLWSAVIDEKSEFAYFGTGTSPAMVVKVRLSDFTRVESISTSKISSSRFKFIAAIKNSTHMNLFMDGVMENSTPTTLPAPRVTDNLMIGSGGQWWSGFSRGGGFFSTTFNGIIDEVRIYNRPLTTNEIKQSMNQKFNLADFGDYSGTWGACVRGFDTSGNSNVNCTTFIVDVTAPSISEIEVTPTHENNGINWTNSSFLVNATVTDTEGSGINLGTCKICISTFSPCNNWVLGRYHPINSTKGYCWNWSDPYRNDTILYINVSIEDNVGNLGGGVEISRKVDNETALAKGVFIIPSSSGGGLWTNSTPRVNATITDSGSGVSSCRYSIDNGSTWDQGTLNLSTGECIAIIPPKVHGTILNITLRGNDSVGNSWDKSITLQRVVDNSSPTVSNVRVYPTSGPYTNSTPYINTTITDFGSGVSSCEYSINNGTTWNAASYNAARSECFILLPTQTDGSILNITFRGNDKVGNLGEKVAEIQRIVEMAPPKPISLYVAPNKGNLGDTFNINFTVSDALSGINDKKVWVDIYYFNPLTYELDLVATRNLSNETFNGNNFNGTWNTTWDSGESKSGTYIFKFNAQDKVGNYYKVYGDSIALNYSSQGSETNWTLFTINMELSSNFSEMAIELDKMKTTSERVNESITIAKYYSDTTASNFIPNPIYFIDIYSTINDSELDSVILKMYYTNAELSSANIHPKREGEIRMYYWNSNSLEWDEMTNALSFVNDVGVETTDIGIYAGYVWANITHLSNRYAIGGNLSSVQFTIQLSYGVNFISIPILPY